LGAVWSHRWVGSWVSWRWVHLPLQVVGCAAGFFIASYTGALLSATNQPVWSDTTWLAPLFLASATSTSLAALSLIAWWKNVGTPEAQERLRGAEPLALGLELVVLAAFLASLGAGLGVVLLTVRGNVLVFGTLLFSVLIPLLLHGRLGQTRRWVAPVAAGCVLLGGLLLRYGAVTTPGEILRQGPSAVARFAPEEDRRVGQSGADVHNYTGPLRPRTKHPEKP
jgi:formate-dependent nitrite reductase membrane component NrfD